MMNHPFKDWMAFLKKDYLTQSRHELILTELQQHPEWVHQRNDDGQTPLIKASHHGHLEIVDALIQAGSDLNAQDSLGWTALMYASQSGFHNTVNLLIRSGSDLNTQDQDGWTALMLASTAGRTKVVCSLLQSGAQFNLQTCWLDTALTLAVHHHEFNAVKLLVEAGADLTLRNSSQKKALDIAQEKNYDLIRQFLETYSIHESLSQTLLSCKDAPSSGCPNDSPSQQVLTPPRL